MKQHKTEEENSDRSSQRIYIPGATEGEISKQNLETIKR